MMLFSMEELLQPDGRRLVLTSYVDREDIISPSAQIAGTYVCQAVNDFGSQQATVDLTLQG